MSTSANDDPAATALFDAQVLIERARLIEERAEDTRRSLAGEAAIQRDEVPTERIAFVRAAEGQLATEATRQAEIDDAEATRQANLERLAVIQAEMETLLQATTRGTTTQAARFDDDASVIQTAVSTSGTQPSSAGTFSDLLGDFLSVERTQTELEYSSMQVISRADRLKLSASDKSKIYAAFSKGTTSKFKASSTIVGLDEISTIENIMSFAQLRLELQKHITGISSHSVFLVLKFDSFGNLIDPDTAQGAPTNLLTASVLPRIEDVEKSTFFHYKRGSAFNQENLAWSYEAIRNSCDKDLQAILDAKMLKYQALERFGPLYYYELVQQMTTVDSKAVRAITQELTSLKVPDHEGQSIAKIAKIVRSTIIWLEMVNMLPPDVDAIVYDILETCTVPDFQLFLKTLSTTASLNRTPLSANELLNRTEEHYRTLILSKRWDAVGHQGSSFQAQRNGSSAIDNNSGGRGNAQRRDRPPITMPSWSRTAPGDGESHERTFENKVFKWCGTCERWFFGDRGHFTHEHVPGYVVSNRRRTTPSTAETTPTANFSAANSDTPRISNSSTPSSTPADLPLAPTLTRNYFNAGL